MSKTAYWSAENVNENENEFPEETNEFDFSSKIIVEIVMRITRTPKTVKLFKISFQ